MTNEPRPRSRRERLRAETFQEIEDASFAIIDVDGVHALSIAALARSMGMSAPALYRYFPSRDALVAHLVTRSYEQLVAAMAEAADATRRTPRTRVRLIVVAYREWALRYRCRYGMLFAAQTGGGLDVVNTQTPLDRSMAQLVDLLTAAAGAAPAAGTTGDRVLDTQLREWAHAQQRPGIAPPVARAAIVIWTRVHGIVSLELTGMLEGRSLEAQRLIDLEVDNAIQLMTPAGS